MAKDIAVASERLEVAVQAPLIDSAGVRTDFTVRRWDEEQVAYARRLSAKFNWPQLDVTRRSIEETAAAVIKLYSDRQRQRLAE